MINRLQSVGQDWVFMAGFLRPVFDENTGILNESLKHHIFTGILVVVMAWFDFRNQRNC